MVVALPLVITSCEEFSWDGLWSDDYPTTFYKLKEGELAQKRERYAQQNQFIGTSINEYGFCGLTEYNGTERSYPPVSQQMTWEELKGVAMEFVENNLEFLGVDNISEVEFQEVKIPFYSSNSTFLISTEQKIDTLEVTNTNFNLIINNGEVVNCWGNWYPDVYIPKKLNFNYNKIRNKLIGRDASYTGLTGEVYHNRVTTGDVESAEFKLMVKPIYLEERIEVRLVWRVYVNSASYFAYVDAVTLEILEDGSTIIS